jgi:peroxiredoxin Q/BCP
MNVVVGEAAPDFTLRAHDGTPWSLVAQRGRPVVLYFYPKDGTPGCTTQACDLRDRWAEFEQTGAVIVGISADNAASHLSFRAEHGLPQTLLVDEGGAVTRQYGAWGPKVKDGVTTEGVVRSCVVVSASGDLVAVASPVSPEQHAQFALDALTSA